MTAHRETSGASGRSFVPAMGLDWLLPLYDPFTSLLGLNRARRDLLLQSELHPGHRVLDIGCGTGSLVVLAKRLFPEISVVGLDPDEKALARAARKARAVGARLHLDRGFADALDYPDASFDRVFSSFMFHHLERAEKERTLREVRRVLKESGTLHLQDFGGPESAHGSPLPSLHGHRRLAENDEAAILGLLRAAGFVDVTTRGEHVLAGLVRAIAYRARKSHA